MAAWEVCPPRAVKIPSAALISLMSSGTVSKRIKMRGTSPSSCRKASISSSVKTTRPEGGMFLWVTLPNQTPAMGLFHEAIKKKVAFVPGDPFYVNKKDVNTLRLNFSCVGEQTIETGIRKLGEVINERAGV